MDNGPLTNVTLLTFISTTVYSKNELLLAALVEIFLAVLGTFGNCMVCVAILKNTNLQIAANFYMLSLAIADLLVTGILVPTRAAQNFALYNDQAVQDPIVHVLSFIGRITILASISSLAVLTNDRRVALKYPLKYRSVIRYAKARAVKAVLGIWAFSLLFTSITLLPGVTDAVFLIGFASFVFTVTAVIVFAYGNIFSLVRRSSRWRASPSYSYYRKRNKIDKTPLDSGPRKFPLKCARLKQHHYQLEMTERSQNIDSSSTAIKVDGFQSRINWGTIKDTSSFSSTEKHDLKRVYSVQKELSYDRKIRRNTHPRGTQLNFSHTQKKRRKTIALASNVKKKTSLRWKMARKIEPYTIQTQIEHRMSTEQASNAIKSKLNGETSFGTDFKSRSTLELEPKRTHINLVPASEAGIKPTQFLDNRAVRATDTALPRSHEQHIEPGTTNSHAVRHQVLSAHPSFGASPSRQSERQTEFRIAKTTAIIVTLFILLVYPRIILIIYSLAAGTKAESIHHAKLWIRILLYCNSVVNPFLYSLRHREIWREFLKWFAPCTRNKRQFVRVTTTTTTTIVDDD